MIQTSAKVISISDGKAEVMPTAESGCGGCRSRSSCAVSGLGRYFSNSRQAILVRCETSVRAGDELQITMSESDFLKAGVLVYLLPSIFTIIGAAMASSDAGAVAGAAAGFIGGMLLVRSINWAPDMTVSHSKFNQGDTP